MKKLLFAIVLLAFITRGGLDRAEIENLSLRLIVGIDLDDDGNLVFSASNPIFDKESKIKEEEFVTRADTLWDSRAKSDRTFMGLAVSGKIQEFLIGKRVMEHANWFRLMDPLFREPKNSVRARMIMVDGPVEDVIRHKPEDKPRLPLYLTKLIDTAHRKNVTVRTMLLDFWNQDVEKGKTACVTELRKESRLLITGTALLDEKGKYRLSIGPEETMLLRMLQNERKGEFSFTFHALFEPDQPTITSDAYSFSIDKFSVKTKTGYADDRFRFHITIKMRATLGERLFPLDMPRETVKLQQDMAEQFEDRFGDLIRKIQQAQIDPIGLGLHARAREYRHWKQVQDHWGEALSTADIHVTVKVSIVNKGLID
jgi:Ger(x)C family germination protein